MRPDPIKPAKDATAEAARAAALERKQRWKELPGNRYTPEELRLMREELGTLTIVEAEPEIMHLD